MAFGFAPECSLDVHLNGLTPREFLVIGIEAAQKNGWEIIFCSESGFTAGIKPSESSWSEEFSIILKGEVATLKSESTGDQIARWGKNKENVTQFTVTFYELKSSLTPAEIDCKYEKLSLEFPSPGEDILNQNFPQYINGKKLRVSFSRAIACCHVTSVILFINMVFFLLMAVAGTNIWQADQNSLIFWGGNFQPYVVDGGWWRLLFSCFVHAGVFHLLINMIAMLFVGYSLEPIMGSARFATAFVISGIFSGITSIYWNELTISVGASGAIFGMYGVILALLLSDIIEIESYTELMKSIGVFVVINLLVVQNGSIDSPGLVGGFISGIIVGYAFVPSLKRDQEVSIKVQTIAVLLIAVFAIMFYCLKQMPTQYAEYEKKYLTLVSMETMAREAEYLPYRTSREKQIAELRNRGIYYWNECLRLLPEMDSLNIPEILHDKVYKHTRYCEVQLQCYELQAKALSGDTKKYDEEIESLRVKANAIMEKLKELENKRWNK